MSEDGAPTLEGLKGEFAALKGELEALKTASPTAKDELEVAGRRFEALLASKEHLQDGATRILTAVAFLTTAAVAIYREAAPSTRDPCLANWSTLFFSGYMLSVALGALFLLGAIWSPQLWRNCAHGDWSLLYFRRGPTPPVGATSLAKLHFLFDRERAHVSRDGKAVSRLVQCGGMVLVAAFYALLALTTSLFLTRHAESWIPMCIVLALVSLVMGLGVATRQGFDWRWKQRNRMRGWPAFWLVVALAFFGFALGNWVSDETRLLCFTWPPG